MNIVLNFPQTIDICSCFTYTISIIIKSLVLIVSLLETDKEQETNELNGIKEETAPPQITGRSSLERGIIWRT